jgi:hypothetical protein
MFHPQDKRRWRPVPHSKKGLLPGEEHLDRTGCLLREHRGNDRGFIRLQFTAETAAHVMPDHAYFRKRQAQNLRDPRLDREYTLRGFPDREGIVVPFCHAPVQFQGCMELARGPVLLFKHNIRLNESF